MVMLGLLGNCSGNDQKPLTSTTTKTVTVTAQPSTVTRAAGAAPLYAGEPGTARVSTGMVTGWHAKARTGHPDSIVTLTYIICTTRAH